MLKILLVDDEPAYLMLTRLTLEEQGHQVTTAENGEEALEKLASAPFDIIISDVYMPIMDGLKFHRAVRAIPEREKLPFLFVSAYDDTYTLSAISMSKYDAFLKKGCSPAEVDEWIRYLLTPVEKRGMPPFTSTPSTAGRRAPHVPLRDPRVVQRGDGTTR